MTECLQAGADVTVAVISNKFHYRIETPDFRDRQNAAPKEASNIFRSENVLVGPRCPLFR